MNKGFVLTLDAIIAGIVVAIVISTLAATPPQAPRNLHVLDRTAQDVAAVLDINGTVASRDQQFINNSISGLLPAGVDYNYRVEYYNVSGSGLVLDRIYAESFIIAGNDTIYAIRAVVILENETQNIRVLDTKSIAKFVLGVATS